MGNRYGQSECEEDFHNLLPVILMNGHFLYIFLFSSLFSLLCYWQATVLQIKKNTAQLQLEAALLFIFGLCLILYTENHGDSVLD